MTPMLARCEPRAASQAPAFHDPAECRLGSGGGAAHALHQGWRNSDFRESFEAWLDVSLKTVLHGGGESPP